MDKKFSADLPRVSKTIDSQGNYSELPSARILSTELTVDAPEDPKSNQGMDLIHTTMVMQMGQFIDHDITHVPNAPNGSYCNKHDFNGKCKLLFLLSVLLQTLNSFDAK